MKRYIRAAKYAYDAEGLEKAVTYLFDYIVDTTDVTGYTIEEIHVRKHTRPVSFEAHVVYDLEGVNTYRTEFYRNTFFDMSIPSNTTIPEDYFLEDKPETVDMILKTFSTEESEQDFRDHVQELLDRFSKISTNIASEYDCDIDNIVARNKGNNLSLIEYNDSKGVTFEFEVVGISNYELIRNNFGAQLVVGGSKYDLFHDRFSYVVYDVYSKVDFTRPVKEFFEKLRTEADRLVSKYESIETYLNKIDSLCSKLDQKYPDFTFKSEQSNWDDSKLMKIIPEARITLYRVGGGAWDEVVIEDILNSTESTIMRNMRKHMARIRSKR